MTITPRWRTAVVGAALIIFGPSARALDAQTPPPPATAAADQRVLAEQAAVRQEAIAKVRENRQAVTVKLREALSANNAEGVAAARASLRQSISAELLLQTAGLADDERTSTLRQRAGDAASRLARARQTAKDFLVNRLATASSDAEREQIFDNAAELLESARAEAEMAAESVRRSSPMDRERDRPENRTQARMRELLDRITSNYVEEPLRPSYGLTPGNVGGAPQAERDAEYWLRQREREADVAEYVRLARGGVFVDPATGAAITGTERQRIARNAEQQLVEALRRANLNEGVLATLMGFADTRGAVAAEREADIAASDEYRALDFITPSMQGAQAPEIFRALGLAVRREQDRINAWRAARIPEGGEGGVTGWLYENFVAKQKVGLGRASEIGDWGLTRDSLEQIDRRIARFQRDADAVVAAFGAAAQTPDPRDLLKTPEGQRHHRLLEQHGYITRAADGAESYRIPTDARVSARLGRNLDLPGSTWLDIISGANVMKLVVLAAAPELAAARFGLLLESLELGAGAVRIGVFVAESLAGSALDAGINLATGEKVDVERMAIESLFLAPILQGAGRLSGEAGGALAGLLKDRGRRQAAETFLTHTLGLASESALQTYWQSHLQGKVTYEDFLSNLVNGAISRGSRGALDRTSTAVDSIRGFRRGQPDIPPALDPVFAGADGAAARREVVDRAAENQKQFDEAVRQLRTIVGDDLSSPDAPLRIVRALEEGRYSWADLKMLYRNDPEKLKPLMAAANAARARFAERIITRARERARRQVDAEFRARTARFNEALKNDPAQLKDALAQAEAWRQEQMALLDRDPFAPGSKDITSDIDRSLPSPYFRNALKDVTDLMLGADGMPPTSARAYDLNEYIDVFPVIKRTRGMDLSSQSPPGFPELTHQQAVEANSLSSAMLHMTPQQRAAFKENMLRGATGDQLATLKLQFGFAEQSLQRGERELRAEIERLVAAGGDRNDPDLLTRARDNLYGRRTQHLHDLEYQLSLVDPASDEAKRLAAEIEREWSFTLREGIETYSTFAGLEVIVVRGQLRDVSIRQLIQDPDFTADKVGVTAEEARAILNDQTLMIVEHVRAFQEGHESLRDAAAALAKYTERAVLALKLMGRDLSRDKAAELDEISRLLMEVRKDPAKLEAALAKFGGGDAERGLNNLIALVEQALPGLEGVFDPALQPRGPRVDAASRPDLTTPEGVARARALLAAQRERERERDREQVQYGSSTAAATLNEELERDRAELAELKADKARTDRLAGLYNRADWARAEALESQRDALRRQADLLPNQAGASAVADGLRKQAQAVESQLTALRARRSDENNAPTDDEFIRNRRIDTLEREIPRKEAEAAALTTAADAEERSLETAPVETQAPSPIDTSNMTELEKAGMFLFGDLPHTPVGSYVKPITTGADEPKTALKAGGGFTPTTMVPPIDFAIWPGAITEDESFIDLDVETFLTFGNNFGIVGTDPSTQRMLTLVEFDSGLIVNTTGRAPEALETPVSGPSADVWLAPIGSDSSQAQLRSFLTSLGGSTGEAIQVHVVNDGDRAVRIRGAGAMVLEPLAASAMPRVQEVLQRETGASMASAKLSAYCLEFLRKPPTPGTVFRIASEELQARFKPLRDVLDAARKLEKLGLLKPDGNPVSYFHAIRQWAIWTKEQGFDLKTFGRAFVERTKQNFASLGQTWTREVENAVLARVPGRWADIVRVLEEVDAQARARRAPAR